MIHDKELETAVAKQLRQFNSNASIEEKEATHKDIQRIQERIKKEGGSN